MGDSKTPPSRRSPRLWSWLIGVGLATFAAGLAWQAFATPQQWLSDEAADEYIDSVVALHGETLSDEPHDHDAGEPAALAEARRRHAETSRLVEAAKWRSRWLPKGVQALGVGLAVAGVLGARITR